MVEKFCEVVKLRNQLARLAGFEVRAWDLLRPLCTCVLRPYDPRHVMTSAFMLLCTGLHCLRRIVT